MAEPADAALILQVARGDRAAGETLINRHQATVRSFLRKLTRRDDVADDLAQETFLRLLRYAENYDPKYPMRTWLLTIARRLSINRLRRADTKQTALPDAPLVSREPDPAQVVGDDEHRRHLRLRLDKALSQMTEPQRTALTLFHQQGLSIEEVAAVMESPTGTVKSHLHRGRAAMRSILEQEREALTP